MLLINQSSCNIYKPIKRKSWSNVWKPRNNTRRKSIKIYASVRLDIRKIENIKQDGEVIGNRVRVKVVKNKVAPPFREAEFDIVYGKGISKSGNILDLGVNLGISRERVAHGLDTMEHRIGQGRENAKKYLEENPESNEQK